MRILAIDPGVTTGLCFVRVANDVPMLQRSQLNHREHFVGLWRELEVFRPDVIICESFQNMSDLRQEDTTKPLEYIGVVKLYHELSYCKLGMQDANAGKAFWDDEKLKKVGLYEKARPHSNDATRHFLYYWTFTLKRNDYLSLLRSEPLPQ